MTTPNRRTVAPSSTDGPTTGPTRATDAATRGKED